MMPGVDGFQLAMTLRQDPDLRDIPLLLVTSSYVEPSDRDLARRAGANDLVVRTPDLAHLIDMLRTTLAGDAPPVVVPAELADLERERAQRIMQQLERQVMLNSGLARRCSSLASELTVLAGISEAVLKHRDLDAALDEALASCFDAGGVAVGALYLLDRSGPLRVRALGHDAAWPSTSVTTFFGHEDLLRKVIETSVPLQIPSAPVARELGGELLASVNGSALLVVPLATAGEPIGALLVVARGRELDLDDWRAFATGVATQISQVIALARAYSAREAAEQRVVAQAAVLAAVIDSAPDLIEHVSVDGTILFSNRSHDAVGKSFFDDLPVDQAASIRDTFRHVATTGEPGAYEARIGHATYSVRLGPVRQDERVVAIVVVARDISERKQAEMQLMLADRMASVGTLAAGVAHEINNPLAAVIANLDMAGQELDDLGKQTAVSRDLVEELRDARLAADRVREIVRDLKIFSRAQEDRRGAVDVQKVLESTLRMAWNEIRHRARVVKNYKKVPRVDANESRLGQVFLNLLVNAVQAIPEGNYQGNEIRIATEVADGQVVVTIGDTGAGMSREVQSRLFTPFFTTKPVGVGTGLGLAISHRIVTQLGGTLTFVSEVGKGTEFRIALPAAGVNLPTITQSMPSGAAAKRRGRVLVIDDEESLVQAMRRYLMQDHDVDGVTSARAALELIRAGEHFDVVLCDLMMPQITGAELHDEVIKLDPALAARMIFVTGGAFTETARAFLDRVPNKRIEKPFDLKALRHIVNEVVE